MRFGFYLIASISRGDGQSTIKHHRKVNHIVTNKRRSDALLMPSAGPALLWSKEDRS
jgi:hypothetical protein